MNLKSGDLVLVTLPGHSYVELVLLVEDECALIYSFKRKRFVGIDVEFYKSTSFETKVVRI